MSLPIAEAPPPPSGTARLGDRSLFPDLEASAYLNHAAISPPSRPVHEAVARALTDYSTRGTSAFATWHAQRTRLKGLLAGLIGGDPDDIGLVKNTTAGLNVVANCVDWRRGDRVVLFRGEFPTNVTPWQQAARTFGLELDWLGLEDFARPEPDFTALEQVLAKRPRLLAISLVQFQTGLRVPLEAIAERCRAAGTEVCVDGIQAVGSTPFDLSDCDYLAGGGHKWLMGVEGAGFLWIHRDRAKSMIPRLAGWLSHVNPADFLFEGAGKLRYDKPIRASAGFVEGGAPNSIGYAALEASVGLIAQLGVDRIFAHANAYHDALEPGLVELGYRSVRHPTQRSAILSVVPPPGVDLARLNAKLADAGVAASTPDGYLRFAPHWPNSVDEVPRVLAAVEKATTPSSCG